MANVIKMDDVLTVDLNVAPLNFNIDDEYRDELDEPTRSLIEAVANDFNVKLTPKDGDYLYSASATGNVDDLREFSRQSMREVYHMSTQLTEGNEVIFPSAFEFESDSMDVDFVPNTWTSHALSGVVDHFPRKQNTIIVDKTDDLNAKLINAPWTVTFDSIEELPDNDQVNIVVAGSQSDLKEFKDSLNNVQVVDIEDAPTKSQWVVEHQIDSLNISFDGLDKGLEL